MVKRGKLDLNVCVFIHWQSFLVMNYNSMLSIAPKAEDPRSFKHLNPGINQVIDKIIMEWPHITTSSNMDPNGNAFHCTTRMAFMKLFSNNLSRLINIMHYKKDTENITQLENIKITMKEVS
jgi:hypothetical protein